MSKHQFRSVVRFFNEQHEKLGKPDTMWSANTRANLPKFTKKDSIWQYHGIYADDNEKTAVIIGASPSLKRDIKYLKNLDRKYFCLFVVNSALKLCLKHDVLPDYVVAIDGDPKNLIGHLDIEGSERFPIITSNAVAPEAIDTWKGQKIWMAYYSIDKELKPKVRRKLGATIPCGGNSVTTILAACYIVFGMRGFVFVGNEYCYDKQYYVDKKSKWDADHIIHFNVKDVNGKDRYTNLPLFQYKMWIERFANELPGAYIDTSFGILGTDCDNIMSLPLKETIQEVYTAYELKNSQDWRVKEKLRYEAAYATGNYLPAVGQSIWNHFESQVDISTIHTMLDVGCGLGSIVQKAREKGIHCFGIDISSLAREYWQYAGVEKYCTDTTADRMPFKDHYFDLVWCTEVLEHVPEEGVMDTLREIKRVGKDKFFFTVCMKPAKYKMPNDNSEPHVCIKPIDWWIDRFFEAGYEDIQATMANHQQSAVIFTGLKKMIIGDYNGSSMCHNNVHVQPREAMYAG